MFSRAFAAVRDGALDGGERAALMMPASSTASSTARAGDVERGCSTPTGDADRAEARASSRATLGAVVMAVCALGVVAAAMMGRGGDARGVVALGAPAKAPAKTPAKAAPPEDYKCYGEAETNVSSALAALGGTLPSGCLKGKCIDVSESARMIADVSEHIYVVCMACDRMRVPTQWAEKVTFIRGEFVDKCYKGAPDHWHKASMSHVHAMNDARANGYSMTTIIEEDAATKEPSEMGREFDVNQIIDMLRSNSQWRVARVGYRPYFFEAQVMNNKKYGCPASCRCEAVAKHACMIAGGACDIRSSDFYLVRMEHAFPIQQMVQAQGSTIDMQALQRVKNQVYVVPQLSYQNDLDATFKQQFNMATRFRDFCFVPGETPELGGRVPSPSENTTTGSSASSADTTTSATVDAADDVDAEYNSDASIDDAHAEERNVQADTDVATIGAADVYGASDFSTFFLGDM